MMKKLSGIIISICLAFCIPYLSAQNTTRTISQPITIIGNEYYPPYEMLDANGNPEGFCIDVIKEVMNRLHLKYVIKLVPRNQIVKQASAARTGIALELTYTEDRAKLLHFGTIWNYALKGTLYRKYERRITRFEQFAGLRVAAEENSIAERLLRNASFHCTVVPVKNLMQAVGLLDSGQCDALFCNLDIAKYIAEHDKGMEASDVGLPPEKFCLSSNNELLLTKIDFAIFDLKKEGTYDRFLNKWLNYDKSEKYLDIIYVISGVILLLAVLFIIYFILLRHQVKRARQQIIRQQNSLDMTLRASDMGIWGFTVEENRFYNLFCDYFPPEGRTYDEELSLMHPDDVHIFNDAMLSAIAGNPPEHAIRLRMDNTGMKRWRYIEKELLSVRDEKGKVVKIIGTHKDVTDDIAQQQQILELLNEHEIMFNQSSVGTQYFDANGYLTKINDAACRIFGVKDKNALIASRPNIFEYPMLKEHIDRNNLKSEHFIVVDDFDKNSQGQFGLRERTGKIYIETFISPVYDSEHQLIKIIVNNTDLTEQEQLRRQVEDFAFRMKYMLKASGILTWSYNPDTHKSCSIDESTSRKDEVDWPSLVHNVRISDRAKVAELFNKMDKREIDTFRMQVCFDRTYVSDKPSYYTIDGTPLRDNDGNILYYIGLSIEITDMIEVQNNLLREKEEAQKADRLKSSFIANMSHEIRTPLNSIVGFSDYLQYVTDEKERKQFIDIIKSNNERLLSIIGDILDFSQIESGTMKITVGPVEINPILHDIYESFSHQLAGSKVEVMIDPHDDDCTVQCDALRLSQVINNFMSNAAKYTSEGHIRIGYTEENNGVKIFVEDTGKGIPADQKDKVFDRFEKLNSFVPGTGLGLSICRDITKMFHGKIGVESEEGKGSTFWIWIPKKSPAENNA